jgi:murein DD-endopeptidase MepM/ murein hydrolase activator NlpD
VELGGLRPRCARMGAAAATALAITALAVGADAAAATPPGPRPAGVRCEQGCAGPRAAAAGSLVRFTGSHLSKVTAVAFPRTSGGSVRVDSAAAGRRSLEAVVPSGAATGRPVLIASGGRSTASPEVLRIVPASRIPAPGSFRLLHAGVSPRPAFFDAPAKISYRFRARGRADVALRIVRARTGETVRRWVRHDVAPYARHTLAWNGTADGDGYLRSGHYVLRIGQPRGHGQPGSRFHLYDAKFPVRGPHSFGGAEQRFGAPRSGGRIHQGQDTFAACGTREVAAVGGTVQARGYDPVLYGNWLVIDGRGTTTDYRYAHLIAPTPLHTHEHVSTGQLVGRVGKTGNARTVGCMLHLEIWPGGWERGSPIDPLPFLRRWDRYS